MSLLDRLLRAVQPPQTARMHGAHMHGARMHVVRGIAVHLDNTRDDIRDEDVLARLDESLALIERYAPARWRHFRRDVRAIRIERFPTRGAFYPDTRDVLTELTFLNRRDITPAPVASSILHEGVHARVAAFRARVRRSETFFAPSEETVARDRAREERLCRRAELAFGRALPPDLGAPVIERVAGMLELTDEEVAPVVDWRVARARQDDIDRGGA